VPFLWRRTRFFTHALARVRQGECGHAEIPTGDSRTGDCLELCHAEVRRSGAFDLLLAVILLCGEQSSSHADDGLSIAKIKGTLDLTLGLNRDFPAAIRPILPLAGH
jgi:hypothetical protein